MPVTHVAVLLALTPVDSCTGKALVTTAGNSRLVEPAAGLTSLGIHQIQCVTVVVLCGEVSLTATGTSLIEVPAGNDVCLRISCDNILIAIHRYGQFAARRTVVPVGEGHQTLILAGRQDNRCTSLIHPLAVNHCRSGTDSNHVVIRTVNIQFQLVSLHLLEVGGQCLVTHHVILELSLSGNFRTCSIRPVHKVVSEVLGGSQRNLCILLVFISIRIFANTTAFFRTSSNSKGVHIHRSLGTVNKTFNDYITETAFLSTTNTNSSRQCQLFARGQSSLLLSSQFNLNVVGPVAISSIFVLILVVVGTRSSKVAQRDGFTFSHLGRYGDTILSIRTEALNPHADLRRSKCQALSGLHYPFHSLCLTGRLKLDERDALSQIVGCTACNTRNGEVTRIDSHRCEGTVRSCSVLRNVTTIVKRPLNL